ncbi:MAG: HAMP domain-containing histidine kinase [Deltaproteobacteria bacterium]|nr:HAMP domain-containing histidine kinase [Deltaproteobacteria bacterium]
MTAEREVKRLQKVRDDFFSIAAHEIRTPITVIKAQAQLAERFHAQGRLQGELVEKTLRVFVQESDRLARLCNDLLDTARIDSGCFEVYLSEFQVASAIEEAVARYRGRVERHQFVFEAARPEAGALVVRADRERTMHVLDNLLNNAIRFSPGGGEITVSLSVRRSKCSITVRDRGLGIPGDRLKGIFKRYYQAHQSGLKGPCGLGLGLYVCRESVRRMGGNIRVKSEGDGQGSEFTFTLPLAARATETFTGGITS